MSHRKTGGHVLLDALSAHGVDTAFGYPGGAIMPLYDALFESSIKHYLVRHEQGAVFAAGGYARTSGRLGVCFATSGPGATNMVTGLTDALMDSVPVLAITGQVRSALLGTDAFQEADVTSITAPCTKYNAIVSTVDEIPKAVARCVRAARSGRPGPVLLDVTNDALKAIAATDAVPAAAQEVKKHGALRGDAAEAIRLIASSKRPVIIVGGGCRAADAVNEFREFARLINAPVVATINGLGAADPISDRNLGMFGMHGHKAGNIAVGRADCLVALGMRFDDRVTGDLTKFGRGAKIIHCDVDPMEINKIVPCHASLVGDLRESLTALLAAAHACALPDYADWWAEVSSLRRPLPRARNDSGALSATDLLDAFAALVDRDVIITTDVGQHQMWAAQRLRPSHPRNFLTSAGLGAMGFGLPAAIGAQVARPDAKVVAIVGDGGLQMTMNEFSTIRRYELPVKVLVLDNRHLGMVRQWQEMFYDRRVIATDLWDNPDFCAIARAYGLRANRVDRAADLRAAIGDLLDSREASLLHCACYPVDNCFPMIPPGKHLDQIIEEAV